MKVETIGFRFNLAGWQDKADYALAELGGERHGLKAQPKDESWISFNCYRDGRGQIKGRAQIGSEDMTLSDARDYLSGFLASLFESYDGVYPDIVTGVSRYEAHQLLPTTRAGKEVQL
jgi:hypothetical protein